MKRVLLVPDLPIERWPSMDRYALRIAGGLREEASDFEVCVAGPIDQLTVDHGTRPGDRHSQPSPLPMLPSPGTDEFRRYLARYWKYPRRVAGTKTDLVHVLDHSYAHILRATRDTPSIVTVHDLIPLLTVQRKPHNFRERIRNALLARVLDSLRKADAWIVATEWLKKELEEWLDEDERIHVIPYGVDDAFFAPPVDGRDVVRKWWKIPEDAFVVLHVGSLDKRKNFGAVLAAVDGLRSEGVEAWLLQVGGTLTPEHVADVKARNLEGALTTLGATNEADLRAAYRASDVLLFPSLYEGFGLPVLEAMASELPVVTSGAGGLAEVVGDAALVVGGREVEPYTVVLKGIAESEEARATLARRGLEQARRFRWADTARRTAQVYRSMI